MDTTLHMELHPRRTRAPRAARLGAALLAALCALPLTATAGSPVPDEVIASPATQASAAVSADMPGVEFGLEPGEFIWTPEASTAGEMVIVVSLPEQRAHVYRGGTRIGVTTVSTGKPGKETPTGVFNILQKKRMHHSNLYDNAPMPFMQRLTWDGIALHAGKIPGHPASHGCVRLPLAFAEKLFSVTDRGMTVVVADHASHAQDVVVPGTQAPVDAITGLPLSQPSVAQALLPPVVEEGWATR